jgi:hypothetical protein
MTYILSEKERKQNEKVQLELCTLLHRFHIGQISHDKLCEATQGKQFTKSALWVWIMREAARRRKNYETKTKTKSRYE